MRLRTAFLRSAAPLFAGVLLLGGCLAAPVATIAPGQTVTVTNRSTRALVISVGWQETVDGRVTAGKTATAVLRPCTDAVAISVSAEMWRDLDGSRGLPVGILVDQSHNVDAVVAGAAPLGTIYPTELPMGLLTPIWTRGDITSLPIHLLVDRGLEVVEVSGAIPSADLDCRPAASGAPTRG